MWSKRKEIDVKRGRLLALPAVISTRSFEQQQYELHEINDHNKLHADDNSSDFSSKKNLRNYTTELTVDINDFNFVTALDYALVMVQDGRREIELVGSWLLTREMEYVHESMSDEHKKSGLVMEALLAASEAFTQIEYFFIGTDNGQMYLWPLLPPHFISRFMHEWHYLQKSINHITSCATSELPCVPPDCNNMKRLIHRHAREEPVIAIQRLGVLVCSISTDGCVAISRFHPMISPVTTFQQSRPLRSVCVWEGQIFTSRANTTLCSASSQELSIAGESETVHPETKYGNELTQKSQREEQYKSAEEEQEYEEQREMECKECNTSNNNNSTVANDATEVASVSNEKKVKANNLSTLEKVQNEIESTSIHEMSKHMCRTEHNEMEVKQEPCNKNSSVTKPNMADWQRELWNASMHVVEQRAVYICTGDDAAVVRLWRVDVLSHHATLMHVFVCCPTLTRMHSPLEICQREDTEKSLHARETTMSVHCLCIDADRRLLAGLDSGIYVWALDRLSWHGKSEFTDNVTYDNCTNISLTGKTNSSRDHHSNTVITSQHEPLPNETSECVEEFKKFEQNDTNAENVTSVCDYHVPWESNHHLCWDEEHNMPLLSSLQSCAITNNAIKKKSLNDVISDSSVDDKSMKTSREAASLENTCNFVHYNDNHEKHDSVAQKELRLLQLRASRLINHHVWLAPSKCVESELTHYNIMNKINDSNNDAPATTSMKRKAQFNSRKLQASKWKDQYAVKLTDGRAIGVVCNEVQFAHLQQDDDDDINIYINSCDRKDDNVEEQKYNPMHYCLHNSLVTICFDDGETRKDIKLPLSCVAPVVYPLQYMHTAQTACFALLVLSNNEYVVSSGSDGAVRVWKWCNGNNKNGKLCEKEEEEYVLLFITSHYSTLSPSNGMTGVITRGLGRMLCLLSPRRVFVSCGFDDGLVKEWHLYTEPEELLRCERRFTLQCSSSSSLSSSSALPICRDADNGISFIDKSTAIRAISPQTQNNDDNYQTDKNSMNKQINQFNAREMSTCTQRKENELLKCTDNNKLTSVLEHTNDEYGKLENSVSGISCIVSFPAFNALFIVGVFECVIQTFTLTEVQGCDVPANYIYNGYKTIKLPLNDLPSEYNLDETLPVQKFD